MPYAQQDLRTLAVAGGPLRVETTTLLPGGALATLSIRRVGASYAISDDNAARDALLALGIDDLNSSDTRRGNEIAVAMGLVFDGGGFTLREVFPEQFPAAIAYVADACRSWIGGTIEAKARRKEKSMVERAVRHLRSSLPGLRIDLERDLLGASSKRHCFDVVVTLPDDRLAVFETVVLRPASLAALHLKFYDLGQAAPDWPRDALVEDFALWPSDDLAVVKQVASHIRSVDGPWPDLSSLAA